MIWRKRIKIDVTIRSQIPHTFFPQYTPPKYVLPFEDHQGPLLTDYIFFKQIGIKYLDDSLGWVAFDDEGVPCWPREPGFRRNSISELDGARRLPAKLLRDPAAAPALGIPDSATALRPWIELDDRIPTDLHLLIHVGSI